MIKEYSNELKDTSSSLKITKAEIKNNSLKQSVKNLILDTSKTLQKHSSTIKKIMDSSTHQGTIQALQQILTKGECGPSRDFLEAGPLKKVHVG